jgi:hypothetical protein
VSDEKVCGICGNHPESFDGNVCAAFRYHGGQPFGIDEIARVDREWTNGSDEPSFAWLFELKDGRWGAGSGSHDYTGWDCQSSFTATAWPTREEAIRFGLTLNDRCNLGLLLPGETPPPAEVPEW